MQGIYTVPLMDTSVNPLLKIEELRYTQMPKIKYTYVYIGTIYSLYSKIIISVRIKSLPHFNKGMLLKQSHFLYFLSILLRRVCNTIIFWLFCLSFFQSPNSVSSSLYAFSCFPHSFTLLNLFGVLMFQNKTIFN